MTIRSINIAYGASSYGAYNKKLTQQTKDELEKLGIAYDKNITEDKARVLIKSKTVKTNSSAKEETSEGRDDLFEKAVRLAKKLGIVVTGRESFQEIMSKIESVIKQKAMENKTDIKALEELKSISYEFSALQAQTTGSLGFNSTKSLMDSLEMLSKYNRTFLY